ncbi:hypothetical protein IQ07DRAFT_582274 [Pyrenochaeta sp. DS3sAY3a]|nr:hypothetical protein IQ07DRAFT_582274 [Pyrenochaeta sp. DS3sAY3a]
MPPQGPRSFDLAHTQEMLVAVSLLAISFSFLIYQHPPSSWLAFITRLQGSAPRTITRASQVEMQQQSATDEPTQAESQAQTTRASSPSPQTTPKAVAKDAAHPHEIPQFSLTAHENDDSDDDWEQDNLPPPSFPAMNSAQRASAPSPSLSMAPPPKPTLMAPPSRPASSSLMPPPRVAASNLRALPTTSPSLRVPTTGPLPNRGPVPNRGPPTSNGGLGVPASAGLSVKTPNARGKVLLSPGHSPLDWANLQRSGKNLSGVDTLVRVSPAMLKEKNGRKGKPAWSSYQGKVYNISPYLPFHPGGEGELRRAAGKDGTKLFMEVHPWVNWENMLGECLVGILVNEEQVERKVSGGDLEDMD